MPHAEEYYCPDAPDENIVQAMESHGTDELVWLPNLGIYGHRWVHSGMGFSSVWIDGKLYSVRTEEGELLRVYP